MSIVPNSKRAPSGARTSASTEEATASQPSEQDGYSYKDTRSIPSTVYYGDTVLSPGNCAVNE